MSSEDKESSVEGSSRVGSPPFIPVDEHEELVSENGKTVTHRGVYLLPNLFTTAALFGGFYAIVASIAGQYEAASIAIFVAMLFDGLDGRVARLTGTTSEFGVQYDSLSDMVSFGVAPALVMFSWGLSDLGKIGWGAAFIYIAAAALRLARFNTFVGVVDKSVFVGLASPAAAALIASVVWVGHDIPSDDLPGYLLAAVTVIGGLLMVSNIRYSSFKSIDLKGRVPFVVLLAVVLVFGVVSVDPARTLLLFSSCYALSGVFMHIYRLVK